MAAAKQGNTEAQAGLSLLYILMEEYSKAIIWAHKAAQTNHPLALKNLGQIYMDGLGVEVDKHKGLKYYELAAENGDADAQNFVGNIYTDADFVEHDYKKAFENYQKAAAQGHAYGMFNLGLCYRDGQGIEKNISLAKEWIQKAADAGTQEAITILSDNPMCSEGVASIGNETQEKTDDYVVFEDVCISFSNKYELWVEFFLRTNLAGIGEDDENYVFCISCNNRFVLSTGNMEAYEGKDKKGRLFYGIYSNYRFGYLQNEKINNIPVIIEIRKLIPEEFDNYDKLPLIASYQTNIKVYYESHLFGKDVLKIVE